jgi:3',5'-cyclic AMP phosphodiesterase CpdA
LEPGCVWVESQFVATLTHISDLHFGRPAVAERLDALRKYIAEIKPDAVAISGDLTQRCTNSEFSNARAYLDSLGEIAPYAVVPGNHDIRWLGAVARNLGLAGLFREQAHKFKYSRYVRHISAELSPSLEVPGVVIAGVNTAHGITRGSITRRLRDLGVIGQVRHSDVKRVREIFEHADSASARIVMMHHNPIRGEQSGRHGLANTEQALHVFADLGTELILCGHDHQDAIHTIERGAHGLIISTAGTISNRIRPGRASSFNVVQIKDHEIHITAHAWRQGKGFIPSEDRAFPRRKPPGRLENAPTV